MRGTDKWYRGKACVSVHLNKVFQVHLWQELLVLCDSREAVPGDSLHGKRHADVILG